jgi:hypothetical protein
MGDINVDKVTHTKSQVPVLQVLELQEPTVDLSITADPPSSIRMKSVERVSKLPVVEETLKIAINIYGEVRVRPFL